ncbi:MAG: hypothetical protein IJS83_05585 [Acholeplasmatales bacterium]|nr:hypothetical protein [Acholeplasmatales bacterium]
MDKIIMYFLFFIIYAFLGYICEVIYVFIITKKITNRGYLYGPLVPIYAFGALLIMIPLTEFEFGKFITDRWYLVVIIGFLLPTLLEYLTSYFMEKIFHMRWWDYSDKFLNINGRVCLRNSTMFMALVVLVVYLINPFLSMIINYVMNIQILAYILAIVLFIVLSVDMTLSTIKHINISKIIIKLEELKEKANDFRELKKEELSNKIDEAKIKFDSYLDNVKDKLNNISIKYPSLKVIKNKKLISLKELINKKKN